MVVAKKGSHEILWIRKFILTNIMPTVCTQTLESAQNQRIFTESVSKWRTDRAAELQATGPIRCNDT